MPKPNTRRRAAMEADVVERCFLCGKPVLASEREDAFERVVDDRVPAIAEVAHDDCAGEVGLWEEAEEGDEDLPRIR